MTSRVLVVNAGSSSLKFKLFDWAKSGLVSSVSGLLERVGEPLVSSVTVKGLELGTQTERVPVKTHSVGLQHSFDILREHVSASIAEEVRAVGHRIVHGGAMTASCPLDEAAKEEVTRAAVFAPLHNPAHLDGVRACEDFFPGRPQVGVFDTAFHHTMPAAAHVYALPYDLYEQQGVRRFGAHGTSYRYILQRVAEYYRQPPQALNLVVAHLGAGSSVCCIKHGRSVDTSMGMTPLEGLVMATRSGDIDPGMLPFLAGNQGLGVNDLDRLLNKQSGLLGLSGHADMRTIMDRAAQGDARCQLAQEVFTHRLRKYIGAYLVNLGLDVHAIVFSGGIGEHCAPIREHACAGLSKAGITMDSAANAAADGSSVQCVSTPGGIDVLVVPTDEELCIARDTVDAAGLRR